MVSGLLIAILGVLVSCLVALLLLRNWLEDIYNKLSIIEHRGAPNAYDPLPMIPMSQSDIPENDDRIWNTLNNLNMTNINLAKRIENLESKMNEIYIEE